MTSGRFWHNRRRWAPDRLPGDKDPSRPGPGQAEIGCSPWSSATLDRHSAHPDMVIPRACAAGPAPGMRRGPRTAAATGCRNSLRPSVQRCGPLQHALLRLLPQRQRERPPQRSTGRARRALPLPTSGCAGRQPDDRRPAGILPQRCPGRHLSGRRCCAALCAAAASAAAAGRGVPALRSMRCGPAVSALSTVLLHRDLTAARPRRQARQG